MRLRQFFPVDRWTTLVLAGSLLLLGMVAYLDYLTPITLLLLYLAPMIAVSWHARGYWWVLLGLLESGLWYTVRYYAPPPDAIPNGVREPFDVALVNTLTRLGVLLLVGFLCSRLKHFSRRPDSLRSSHDPTGLLSAVGLEETICRHSTTDKAASAPVAMLLLDVERKVSAFGGQSTEHSALVGAMIGKLLLTHARPADLCVRLSPNHFLVIMFDADPSAAATLDTAVQDALPEIARALDNTVSIWSLLLYSRDGCQSLDRMCSQAVNHLITLKVMGRGRHHSEQFSG